MDQSAGETNEMERGYRSVRANRQSVTSTSAGYAIDCDDDDGNFNTAASAVAASAIASAAVQTATTVQGQKKVRRSNTTDPSRLGNLKSNHVRHRSEGNASRDAVLSREPSSCLDETLQPDIGHSKDLIDPNVDLQKRNQQLENRLTVLRSRQQQAASVLQNQRIRLPQQTQSESLGGDHHSTISNSNSGSVTDSSSKATDSTYGDGESHIISPKTIVLRKNRHRRARLNQLMQQQRQAQQQQQSHHEEINPTHSQNSQPSPQNFQNEINLSFVVFDGKLAAKNSDGTIQREPSDRKMTFEELQKVQALPQPRTPKKLPSRVPVPPAATHKGSYSEFQSKQRSSDNPLQCENSVSSRKRHQQDQSLQNDSVEVAKVPLPSMTELGTAHPPDVKAITANGPSYSSLQQRRKLSESLPSEPTKALQQRSASRNQEGSLDVDHTTSGKTAQLARNPITRSQEEKTSGLSAAPPDHSHGGEASITILKNAANMTPHENSDAAQFANRLSESSKGFVKSTLSSRNVGTGTVEAVKTSSFGGNPVLSNSKTVPSKDQTFPHQPDRSPNIFKPNHVHLLISQQESDQGLCMIDVADTIEDERLRTDSGRSIPSSVQLGAISVQTPVLMNSFEQSTKTNSEDGQKEDPKDRGFVKRMLKSAKRMASRESSKISKEEEEEEKSLSSLESSEGMFGGDAAVDRNTASKPKSFARINESPQKVPSAFALPDPPLNPHDPDTIERVRHRQEDEGRTSIKSTGSQSKWTRRRRNSSTIFKRVTSNIGEGDTTLSNVVIDNDINNFEKAIKRRQNQQGNINAAVLAAVEFFEKTEKDKHKASSGGTTRRRGGKSKPSGGGNLPDAENPKEQNPLTRVQRKRSMEKTQMELESMMRRRNSFTSVVSMDSVFSGFDDLLSTESQLSSGHGASTGNNKGGQSMYSTGLGKNQSLGDAWTWADWFAVSNIELKVGTDRPVLARFYATGFFFAVVIACICLPLMVLPQRAARSESVPYNRICADPEVPDSFKVCACGRAEGSSLFQNKTLMRRYYLLREEIRLEGVVDSTDFNGTETCSNVNAILYWMADDLATLNAPKSARLQRFLVGLFFFDLSGPRWTNNVGWMTPKDVCNWYGLLCSSSGVLTKILLSANNLAGTLPSYVSYLPLLSTLSLQENTLRGHIPKAFSLLNRLYTLDLTGNAISGMLPEDVLYNFTNLESLRLGSNQITGRLPASLGRMTNLKYIDISSNRLNGFLPTQIGELSRLRQLNISNNTLSGLIPAELGLLADMEVLDLNGNSFEGTLSALLCERLPSLQELLVDCPAGTMSIEDCPCCSCKMS